MGKLVDGYKDLGPNYTDYIRENGIPPPFLLDSKRPVKGLMRIAAMAKIIGDPDWLGGSGGNTGYIIEGDTAIATMVDAGNILHAPNGQLTQSPFDKNIIAATSPNPPCIEFDKLTEDQKEEFIGTLYEFTNCFNIDGLIEYMVERNGAFNKHKDHNGNTIQLLDNTQRDDIIHQILNNIQILKQTYAAELSDYIKKHKLPESRSMFEESYMGKLEDAFEFENTPTEQYHPDHFESMQDAINIIRDKTITHLEQTTGLVDKLSSTLYPLSIIKSLESILDSSDALLEQLIETLEDIPKEQSLEPSTPYFDMRREALDMVSNITQLRQQLGRSLDSCAKVHVSAVSNLQNYYIKRSNEFLDFSGVKEVKLDAARFFLLYFDSKISDNAIQEFLSNTNPLSEGNPLTAINSDFLKAINDGRLSGVIKNALGVPLDQTITLELLKDKFQEHLMHESELTPIANSDLDWDDAHYTRDLRPNC